MVGSNPHSLVVALVGSAIGVLAMLILYYEHRGDGDKRNPRGTIGDDIERRPSLQSPA